MNANEPVAVFVPAPPEHEEWERRFTLNWIDEEPIVITHLYSEVLVRQQQAEIEALKNANRFIQNFAEEQHQRAVALEMRELTNAEIFWLADEYSDEENLVADCVGFARAILRKAQEK